MANEIAFTIKVNDSEVAVKSVKDLETQVKNLTKAWKEMDSNSPEFAETKAQLDSLKSKLNEVNKSQDQLTREAQQKANQIKSAYSSANAGLAESFSNASSALSAFGVSGEGVNRSMMLLGTGLRGYKSIMQGLVGPTKGATLAAKGFGVALKSLGIGLIVAAISALISNFDKIQAWIAKVIDKFEGLRKVIDKVRDALSWITGGLIDDAATKKTTDNAREIIKAFDDIDSAQNRMQRSNEHRLAMLEAEGASEQEIHQQRIQNLVDQLRELNKQNDAYEKKAKSSKGLTEEEIDNQKTVKLAIEETTNSIQIASVKYAKSVTDASKAASAARKKELEDERNRKQEAITSLNDKLYKQIETDERSIALAKETDEIKRMILEESYRHADALREIDAAKQAGADEAAIQRLLDLEAKKQEIALQSQIDAQVEAEAEAAIDDTVTEVKLANLEELAQAKRDAHAKSIEETMSALSAEFALVEQFGQLMLDAESLFAKEGSKRKKGFAVAAIAIEKAGAIGQIWANTAIANAKAVAALPLTLGQPWVTINTITAGISTASVIAAAAKAISEVYNTSENSGGNVGTQPGPDSTPQPSKFARGGFVVGPGTALSDSVPAMLSRGESVMNAKSTEMFGGLLSAMNQAGGGAPIANSTNLTTPIIKTYVVSSEMTSQQEADKKVRDLARI